MSYQDLIPLTFASIVGDTGFKYFANYGGKNYFITGIVGYASVIYFLIRSLQGSTILIVNSAWNGLTEIIENIYAFFILGERLEYKIQYLGIILISLGLICLKVPLKREKKFIFPEIFTNFLDKRIS